jgi:hypothetical protein
MRVSYRDDKRGEIGAISEKWISAMKSKSIPEALNLERNTSVLRFAVEDSGFSLITPIAPTGLTQPIRIRLHEIDGHDGPEAA